eukprot:COSAG02_NODE_26515_length_631_cov_0.945489_1_plen_38_part_10
MRVIVTNLSILILFTVAAVVEEVNADTASHQAVHGKLI